MGRRDVGELAAGKGLASARKKRDQAINALSRPAKNADRGRDAAMEAGQLIRDAAYAADSAVREAEAYNSRAQNGKSRELLEEARQFRASLDTPLVVTEALQRPADKEQQRKLAEKLKGRAKEVAADEISNELLTRLAQYATAHTIDGLITFFSNVPLPNGTAKWAGGAVSEGLNFSRGRWRRARSGVDPETGTCTARWQCVNCQQGRPSLCSKRAR
jgi:hypothetical protein